MLGHEVLHGPANVHCVPVDAAGQLIHALAARVAVGRRDDLAGSLFHFAVCLGGLSIIELHE